MREFAKKNDLRFHFDTNCGVCHQVMPEAGVIYPGMIVVATDSHTTTTVLSARWVPAAAPPIWPPS